MMQLPVPTPDTTAQVAREPINWQGLLQWELLYPKLIKIAVVIVLAIITYRVIKSVIRRIVEREIDEEDPLVKRVREQRARTLASLLANVAAVAVVVVVLLTILDILLENIGPILASFGILGLAISFGAQSLVKDMITGTFMLMEGQFGIGDVVRVSDVSGQVEKITLRTTVLRDMEGIVHIIPNGEITRVSNLTKSWSRTVLNIGVAYKEDVDRVIAVLRDEGQAFKADPEWGPLMLDDVEVLGVDSFGDSSVNFRVVVKTLPLKQWDIARELRRRIKNRFDAERIEIPFPHATLYWGEGQKPEQIPVVESTQ
jgi:small conductance mechanosensitive channel